VTRLGAAFLMAGTASRHKLSARAPFRLTLLETGGGVTYL